MYKGSIHYRDAFEDVLKTLTEVVAISQAHVLGEHNVHLDVQLVAGVICLEALDVLDGLGKAHRQV